MDILPTLQPISVINVTRLVLHALELLTTTVRLVKQDITYIATNVSPLALLEPLPTLTLIPVMFVMILVKDVLEPMMMTVVLAQKEHLNT